MQKWEAKAAQGKKDYEVAMAKYKAELKESGVEPPTTSRKSSSKPRSSSKPSTSSSKPTETTGGSGKGFKSKEYISDSSSAAGSGKSLSPRLFPYLGIPRVRVSICGLGQGACFYTENGRMNELLILPVTSSLL